MRFVPVLACQYLFTDKWGTSTEFVSTSKSTSDASTSNSSALYNS